MAQSDYRKLTKPQLKRLGYSPTSERYIPVGAKLSKGNTISRRAFDNASGKYEAFGGRHNFERRYQVPSWRFFIEKGADELGKDTRRLLNSPTDPLARAAYKAAKAKQRGGRAARNPNGPLAKYLVKIGLRQPDATYDVGDTPP
jgi:hypothetical protein